MTGLSIGEVARRAGVRTSTLRYYESIGVLPEPERVGGQRRYDPEVLEVMAVVRVAQQARFKMAEIRTLLHGFSADTPPSARWRTLANEKLPEVEALIERAVGMRDLLQRGLDCECLRLEDCAIVGSGGTAEAGEPP